MGHCSVSRTVRISKHVTHSLPECVREGQGVHGRLKHGGRDLERGYTYY